MSVGAELVTLSVSFCPARFTAPLKTMLLLPPMVTALLPSVTAPVRVTDVLAWSVPPVNVRAPLTEPLAMVSEPLFSVVVPV
jgi:hypothetical protein